MDTGHGCPWDGDVAKREGASWEVEGRGPGVLGPGACPPMLYLMPSGFSSCATCL